LIRLRERELALSADLITVSREITKLRLSMKEEPRKSIKYESLVL